MPNDRRARLLAEEDDSGLMMPQGFDIVSQNDKQDLLDALAIDSYQEDMRQMLEEEKASKEPSRGIASQYRDLQARPMTRDEIAQYESHPDKYYPVRKRR